MISKEATKIIGFLQAMKMPEDQYEEISLEEKRQHYENGLLQATRLPEDIRIQPFNIEHLGAEWIIAANVPEAHSPVVLYFHGGSCILGSCKSHHGIAAAISNAAKCRVLLIEYRLAPEHPYPAANEDCLLAYQWLLNSGINNQDIIIGGDSAGGALTLMSLLTLRDAKKELPRAAFLLSLFGDFVYLDGESYQTNAEKDLISSNLKGTYIDTHYYVGHLDEKPLILSPIRCDLSNLPPIFIQASSDETVLSDSLRLAERAEQAGVPVTLEIWDGMWHFFQAFSAIVPEAKQAVEHIGAFIINQFEHNK